MRKRKASVLLAGVLLAAALMSGCGQSVQQAKAQGDPQPALYHGDWSVADPDAVSFAAQPAEGGFWQIPAGGSQQIVLEVPAAGEYTLLLHYAADEDVMLRSVLSVQLAGQECMTQLHSIWRDETKDYGADRYGNQTPPTQVTVDEPVSEFVIDQSQIARTPFVFELPAGSAQLTLSSEDVGLRVYGVELVRAEPTPGYAEYRQAQGEGPDGADRIVIEGENYSVKSDSSIRAGAERSASLSPYDYTCLLLNVLDGGAYSTAGQKVQYSFTVENAGYYDLAFHYRQNSKEGLPVYQNIRIDGRSLFAEMESMPFPYTGVEYANAVLTADGEPAGIWLEAGEHTLLLEADGTPLQEAVDRIDAVMEQLSAIGLEMKKLAGTQADSNRTWDVESYLPGVLDQLAACEEALWDIYALLGEMQDAQPAAALGVKQAAGNLEKILERPEKIPGKLSLLSEGSGSATQLLADQIDKLNGQSLTIDAIYLQSEPFDQKENAGFFTELADDVKRFFYALMLKDDAGSEEKTLEVWVNRPVQYMEVLQTMADTDFTPKTGIKVRFSLMPSEQRIVLSNATDMAPDVVMGLATNTPFDLGLRGAVCDLTQFEGFAELMEEYNPESITPYILGDQVFGLTETQDFYVLFYRTDILEQLGLEPPRTWEDVRDLMPVLQRNSMNFYLQLSGYTGTKPLYSTAPFLMQAGGGIYAEGDATRTGINSAASLAGFETLTDLYRLYSVQPTVSSFYNNFRYGQIPLGVGSFSDYVKIKNAAPEIADKWAVALAPGVEDENGVIHNGTTGASSACAIMSGSEMQQESWEFLQWWLSAEVQTTFGNTLQTTYGPEYLWNSANIEAFSQLNFPKEDREVILEQWSQMKEINRHPALYAVERELSNAWQKVVDENTPARIALDEAAANVDREFRRKLAEFGYLDAEGNVLTAYEYVPAQQILESLSDEKD